MGLRTLDEIEIVLNRLAQKVGHVYEVELGVTRLMKEGEAPDLIFTDHVGNPIIDDDESGILCCSAEEIESGVFLKLFGARVLYAALTLRFFEVEISMMQGIGGDRGRTQKASR